MFKIKTHITGNNGLIAGSWFSGQTDRDVFRIQKMMRKATQNDTFAVSTGFARNPYTGLFGAYKYSIQGEKITVTLWVVRED